MRKYSLEEIREFKSKAEQELARYFNEFKYQTGVEIDSVYLRKRYVFGEDICVVELELEKI